MYVLHMQAIHSRRPEQKKIDEKAHISVLFYTQFSCRIISFFLFHFFLTIGSVRFHDDGTSVLYRTPILINIEAAPVIVI